MIRKLISAATVAAVAFVGCSSQGGVAVQPASPSSATAPRATARVRSSPAAEPSATARRAARAGVAAGFVPISVTAISDDTFWVLGAVPCTSAGCLSIVRTADDGAHWRGLGYLDAPSSADGGGGVSSIRFANESDGFAFGPDLYVTHNGARTWAKDAIGGKVRVLDAAAGNVFAVVSINGTDELLRSRASGGSWSRVSLPGDAAPAYASLAVHGSDVWIVGGGRSSQRYLFVSHDGGNSFETLHRACGANLGTALAPVSSSVIWALCVTGMQAELQLSRDGGRRFSGLPPPMPEIPNSAAFGAVDEHKVAVGPACEDLLIIDAQGRSKKAVGGRCNGVAADWAFVGFTDPLHGFALRYEFQTKVPTGELWHTIDGGAEWSKLLP